MTHIAIRWSGLVLIFGAVLFAVATAAASFAPDQSQPIPALANALLFLSCLLLLLSLPGMYARQADAAGWLGLIGHALLQTGILLLVGVTAPFLLYSSFDLLYENSLTAFLLGIAFALGLLLTGIATLRAGVFPKGAGILFLVGTAGFFFDFFIAEMVPRLVVQVVGASTSVLQGLALAWIGFSMWASPPRFTT